MLQRKCSWAGVVAACQLCAVQQRSVQTGMSHCTAEMCSELSAAMHGVGE